MSTIKHLLGILGAGLLAFGAVLAAHALAPDPGSPISHGSESSGAGSEAGPEAGNSTASPVTEEALIGRWRAPEPANQAAFVEFMQYGVWFASDGCNTAQGSWSIGEDGEFLTGDLGGMTQIGCNNVPIPETLWEADSIEIRESDALVLTSSTGTELELGRDTTAEPTTLVGDWIAPGNAAMFSEIQINADGTWSGYTECMLKQGTWKVRSIAPEDGAEETQLSGSSAILSIGPNPEKTEVNCGDSSLPPLQLALQYDTDYWLYFSNHGFTIREVHDTTAGPNLQFFPHPGGQQFPGTGPQSDPVND